MNKLVDLYKKISTDTWNRLEFANKTNSSFSETTATENLLYLINKYRIKNSDNSLLMFESKNERANGDDLEIYLEIENDKYIYLIVQAKRLYTKSQKYQAISHKVNGIYQIDLLLQYSKSKHGIPLYLLYNYAPNFKNKYYGCSIIRADYIYNKFYPNSSSRWRIPTFNDLHTKNAIPFYKLGNNKCFHYFVNSYLNNIKLYNYSELLDDTWIKIENLEYKTDEMENIKTIKEDRDFNNNLKIESRILSASEYFFTPKFKIILKNR